MRAQKERTLGVGGVDEFGDLGLQFFGVLHLFLEFLRLEECVECGDYMAIDLSWSVSEVSWCERFGEAHMIGPQSAISSEPCVAYWKKRRSYAQVLKLSNYQYLLFWGVLELKETNIFHQYGAFPACPVAMTNAGDQTSRVYFQQCLRFFIWINLNILILHALGFQYNPYSLHKRATGNISLAIRTLTSHGRPHYWLLG